METYYMAMKFQQPLLKLLLQTLMLTLFPFLMLHLTHPTYQLESIPPGL